ncbi:uncharacterized protein LOC111873815 [Cryptotermes secundus]|nr:uncharacterized protein LOC111873815 [Cryptotermes secundus]
MLESSEMTVNDDIPAPDTTIQECFNKNSISCVQIQIYRSFKSFVDQDKVDLIGVLSLVREEEGKNQAEARATEDTEAEEQILGAQDYETREFAIESFVYQKLMAFFQERSIQWNLSPVFQEMITSRGIAESLPANLRQAVTNLVTEARGKKKLLKNLIPILIGLKLKAVIFLALASLAITFIAKKAIFVSLISLAISAFVALQKLLGQWSRHPHNEVYDTYSSHGGGGWNRGAAGYSGTGYGQAEYASHASPAAHTLAYGAQKTARE